MAPLNVRPWYWPEEGQPHRTEPFTWIVKGKIAASWWPDPYVFDIYKKEGVKAIVNCCEFDNRSDIPKGFDYYHFNIPDYGTPKAHQIQTFLQLMQKHEEKHEPVVIHCVAGCGRTGQFLVAWCAKAGYIPAKTDPVEWIRSKRSCCLETPEQMKVARKLASEYQS